MQVSRIDIRQGHDHLFRDILVSSHSITSEGVGVQLTLRARRINRPPMETDATERYKGATID